MSQAPISPMMAIQEDSDSDYEIPIGNYQEIQAAAAKWGVRRRTDAEIQASRAKASIRNAKMDDGV